MNWETFGIFAEIISAIAVVVSLIFLAIQLRMNTNTLRASAAWDSEVLYGQINYELGLNPDIALLVSRASDPGVKIDDFNETEMAQLYLVVRGALQFAQAQWWLWRSGSLPNELWQMRRKWAKNFIESPVINPIWHAELEQHIFSEKFAEDIQAAERHGELSLSPRRD